MQRNNLPAYEQRSCSRWQPYCTIEWNAASRVAHIFLHVCPKYNDIRYPGMMVCARSGVRFLSCRVFFPSKRQRRRRTCCRVAASRPACPGQCARGPAQRPAARRQSANEQRGIEANRQSGALSQPRHATFHTLVQSWMMRPSRCTAAQYQSAL
jgi:hypothetical protein